MANNLIPEELQALIDQYLTDGEITNDECQAILNRAVSMGLDPKEVYLYVQNEVNKYWQAADAAKRERMSVICPHCGKSIPPLMDKCPECGEYITPEATKELQEILENLEKALVDLKSGYSMQRNKALVEGYIRKAEMYYSNNPKIKKLVEQIQAEIAEAEKKARIAARNEAIRDVASSTASAVGSVASSTAKGLGATIKYFAWEHKIAIAVILIIAAVAYGLNYIATADDREEAKKDSARNELLEKVHKALDEGDIRSALAYESQYQESRDYYDGTDWATRNSVAQACIKEGMLEEALQLTDKEEIRKEVSDKYIEQGDYKSAENALQIYNVYIQKELYYNFLSKCVVHMKENGLESKAKTFINSKVPAFKDCYDEWKPEKVKKELMAILED